MNYDHRYTSDTKRLSRPTREHIAPQRAGGRILVVARVVDNWRASDPPGWFLKRNKRIKRWNNVDDEKAQEKTLWALHKVLSRCIQFEQAKLCHEVGDAKAREKTSQALREIMPLEVPHTREW